VKDVTASVLAMQVLRQMKESYNFLPPSAISKVSVG